jgi:hypothetical protein
VEGSGLNGFWGDMCSLRIHNAARGVLDGESRRQTGSQEAILCCETGAMWRTRCCMIDLYRLHNPC